MRELNVRVVLEDPDDPKIAETYVLMVPVDSPSHIEERVIPYMQRSLHKSLVQIELMDSLREQGRLLER